MDSNKLSIYVRRDRVEESALKLPGRSQGSDLLRSTTAIALDVKLESETFLVR